MPQIDQSKLIEASAIGTHSYTTYHHGVRGEIEKRVRQSVHWHHDGMRFNAILLIFMSLFVLILHTTGSSWAIWLLAAHTIAIAAVTVSESRKYGQSTMTALVTILHQMDGVAWEAPAVTSAPPAHHQDING